MRADPARPTSPAAVRPHSPTGMPPNALRVLFLVQGEGRGHLSQALALKEMLDAAGHRVVGLLVGGSEDRPIPGYFEAGMGLEAERFPSPSTARARDRAGVSVLGTTWSNLRRAPSYHRARGWIRRRVREIAPDLAVNFYDAVGGQAVAGTGVPLVSVAHQYLLGHPDTPRPPFRPLELLPFYALNRLSAPPGSTRLALSFRDIPDGPTSGTRVVPPLLRKRVLEAEPEPGEHILVYVLNDGYGDEISRWHARHPEVVIHGFWDRPDAPVEDRVRPNLTFHQLSDTLFLEKMRTCRGFVGTAGFESVAEALWLGKPVMVVPTRNQVEQAWNAREARAAGAGLAMEAFDLSPFLDYLPTHVDVSSGYRGWVRHGHDRVLRLLEAAAGSGDRVARAGLR